MLANVLNKLQSQIELVGLDIGSTSIKLIRLQKNTDGYTVTRAVQEPVEQNAEDSQPTDARVKAVKQCFAKANISQRNVVCGIEGSQVVIRGFKFPPLPPEAIDQAVQFEAQQVCPFDSKKSVLDYQLIESPMEGETSENAKAERRNGVLVISTEEAVREKKKIVADAGGQTIMVDASALALINCLNELDILDTSGTVAVVDIGSVSTNVVIYGQDGLPFVRVLNHAGQDIIHDVSEQLDVSVDQIRQVLSGQQVSDDTNNQILLAINNAVRPLATAINETLRFYSFQEKGAGVEKVYLCGGFSLMKTLVEFLSDALSVDVQILNPFERITCNAGKEGNEQLKTCGPAWAVAAGLAMRTI